MADSDVKIDPNAPNWVKWLTGLWILIGLGVLAYYWMNKTITLSDIGGFLAGIFAPVAWLWFVLAFRLQSQQLRVQHRELQLQREEMRSSVEAQQGSEEALKNQYDTMERQSKALEKQLEIASRQYADYLST